ncbi:acetyl-CoA carboxylase biotin carboxyl carrier protein [Priestia aryabhattai]|uniref:acetyl-CoA carboxylase biotin carboxyl carrier protein n=1 Tax=Priestia aryabhattai TaxID=412384 RepID=UPI001874444B|nr:acetyl-CoA carboxylase biotin carboxyl carrier protein [Priestia aryabhattai]MBE5102245.1 acetyl-CoA carboxylase biotin carboxyl carrier protein [Priestia aryabhattai]
MDIAEIRALIDALDQSSINELEYEKKEMKIKLKKRKDEAQIFPLENSEGSLSHLKETLEQSIISSIQENDSQSMHKQEIKEELFQITSPMVGTFYNASSPTEDPYVKVGQEVNEGTIVCMVEAMKLFNEIESEVKGTIEKILVGNGELVEYGQPLFLVNRK